MTKKLGSEAALPHLTIQVEGQLLGRELWPSVLNP